MGRERQRQEWSRFFFCFFSFDIVALIKNYLMIFKLVWCNSLQWRFSKKNLKSFAPHKIARGSIYIFGRFSLNKKQTKAILKQIYVLLRLFSEQFMPSCCVILLGSLCEMHTTIVEKLECRECVNCLQRHKTEKE